MHKIHTTGEEEDRVSELDNRETSQVLGVDDVADNAECRDAPWEFVEQGQQ